MVEMLLPPGNDPSFTKLIDLESGVFGGTERSEEEYRCCRFRGFHVDEGKSDAGSISILESVPA